MKDSALARGHRAATLAQLDSARQRRAGPTAASVQVSQVFQEAWLRAAAGDSSGAMRQLDDAFGGLPARGTLFLRIISEAAAIGRGMRLRSELAQRRGDVEDAQRWLRRAKDLLDGADPELRP